MANLISSDAASISDPTERDDRALLENEQPQRRRISSWKISTKTKVGIVVAIFVLGIFAAAVPFVIWPISSHSQGNTTTTTPSSTTAYTKPETKTTAVTKPTTSLPGPYCEYVDPGGISCPDGPFWSCWNSKSKRDKTCTAKGWDKCWLRLVRVWYKHDCYCCSAKEWLQED